MYEQYLFVLCISVGRSVCPSIHLRLPTYIPTYPYTYLTTTSDIPTHVFQSSIHILQTSSYLTEIAISATIAISSLAREEDQLTILTFPPRNCEAKDNTVYGTIIPECALGAVLTCMLVIIGWVIYKVNRTLYNK